MAAVTPVLITNPRSGTHYLKALIAESLHRRPVEREYATAWELNATLSASHDGALIYGHFPFREFGSTLDAASQPNLRLVLLTRHPIDRMISQLALTRAQGGRLPDPTRSPQRLARELLLGEWDGRPWADGFVVADYAALHNFYLRQLHTDWLASPSAIAVKFEDLIAAPQETLARILAFLGARVSPRRIRKVTGRITFQTLANGRRPGEADPNSHYRKGQPGEWRQVFSAADIERMRPKYAAAFHAAGYEL